MSVSAIVAIMAIVGVVAVGFAAILVILGARTTRLARELDTEARACAAAQQEARALQERLVAVEEETRIREARARDEIRKHGEWLDQALQEVRWNEEQLKQRPALHRKPYTLLTLGVKATGKTSLTLKWSNPLTNLGTLEGTKIERYERTVSIVREGESITEHVFQVHDWGGEHIVDALQEMMIEEIHGLLIVVDLGDKDAHQADPVRIQEQLLEFQPQSLKFFFSPKTVASCKTVVLFINKSDLLSGTPVQVEEQAKQLYAPLIEHLSRYSTQIDVRVMVGSASYGHSTHLLFSHFVERILPKSAYDGQLLQRMKSGVSASLTPPASTIRAALPPPSPPPRAPATSETNVRSIRDTSVIGRTEPMPRKVK
jgi:GTPase SAR1 family protein